MKYIITDRDSESDLHGPYDAASIDDAVEQYLVELGCKPLNYVWHECEKAYMRDIEIMERFDDGTEYRFYFYIVESSMMAGARQ